MTLSVIIPAWNLWELTLPCLQSLAGHSDASVEVVVVDNGSADATVEALAPTLHELFGARGKAVRLPENQGFARGCNAGARAASGDALFFLNNDTLVTQGWLPPLVRALQSPLVGMAGPLLLFPPQGAEQERGAGQVQHCGIVFAPTLEVSHLYALFPGEHPVARKPRTVQALTGAALLLEKSLFWRCGGFHEGYVNGFEDMDLCCAVRREGLRLVTAPQSIIYHLTSQTPGRFDCDGPNGALLNARWPGAFAPDLHRFALEDGYVPTLSPGQEIYLTLPAAKEEALTAAFARQWNEERCLARLEAEPLWQGGYALLAEHREREGRLAEACTVRSRATHFFPLSQHFVALARTAAQWGDAELARQAGQAAEDMLAQAVEYAQLQKKADALARWGESVGDAALADLFKKWQPA